MSSVLVVVPARGGSKGVARKNLRQVCGVSLIKRAVCCALQAFRGSVVYVSTDDTDIQAEGLSAGGFSPRLRPLDLAGDYSSSLDVWKEELEFAERAMGRSFEYTFLLEPTSPCREVGDLHQALDLIKLQSNQNRFVVSVSLTPSHYSYHKSLHASGDNLMSYAHERGADFTIRQHVPKSYHRNGIVYAVRSEVLKRSNDIIGDGFCPLLIERPVVNIDSEFDLQLAEYLLSR